MGCVCLGGYVMTVYNIEDYNILKYNKGKYNEYSHHELALFVQEAQRTMNEICWTLFDRFSVDKTINEILEEVKRLKNKKYESDAIMAHWETFQKHLEDNPTLKEEWDALCMGIKLTEDFD